MKRLFSLFFIFISLFLNFNFLFAAPSLDNLGGLGGGFNNSSASSIAEKGQIKTEKDVPEIINSIITIVLGIFATIILGIIIYAGIKMITSKGKTDVYMDGLKLLRVAIVAMLIILLSYVISNFALKTISLMSNN